MTEDEKRKMSLDLGNQLCFFQRATSVVKLLEEEQRKWQERIDWEKARRDEALKKAVILLSKSAIFLGIEHVEMVFRNLLEQGAIEVIAQERRLDFFCPTIADMKQVCEGLILIEYDIMHVGGIKITFKVL
ncbi:MAG: hypothetical protein WC663_05990 [Patescibacteria group bacterium]|jgi:hypothetical protein